MSNLFRFISLPIRGCFESRARFYAALLKAKLLTPSEVRQMEGL